MTRRTQSPIQTSDTLTVDEYKKLYGNKPVQIRKGKKKTHVDLEGKFFDQIKMAGLQIPDRQHKGWHPAKRMGKYMPYRWAFDFAIPAHKIAIEIEGGTMMIGRHQRPAGYEKDCIKYNEAQLLGWRVYRFTTGMVTSGRALDFYQKILETL